MSILDKYGVKENMIISEKYSTSYSVVLAILGIDRIFLHNPGANHYFTSDDIDEEILGTAKLFHFSYPPLMKSIYKNDGEDIETSIKLAMATGASSVTQYDALSGLKPLSELKEKINSGWKKLVI